MIAKLLDSFTFDPQITKLILILSLVVILLTILIRVFFRSFFFRIVPGLALISFATFKLIKVLPIFLYKSSLRTLTEAMILFILGTVNISTGIIIALLVPYRKRRRKRKKPKEKINENPRNQLPEQ